MSANIPFLERFDARGGVSTFDPEEYGAVRADDRGKVVAFGQHRNIAHSDAAAVQAMTLHFRRSWPDATKEQCEDAAKRFLKSNLGPIVSPGFRRQDGPTDFVTSGLEIQGETLIRPQDPTLFVPGPGRTLALPSQNILKPGWRTNSYKIRAYTAQAKWADPNAVRELNYADYQDEKESRGAEYYGILWGYNVPETWEANILGDDLTGERQTAANRGLDDFRERVSWWGSADKNIQGIATVDGADLLLCGQQFSSMVPTAVQILQRIAAMEARYMLFNQGRKPSHCIIPDADRLAMQNIYFGDNGSSESAWERAVKQYAWIRNAFFSDNLMFGNEAGTATRWIIYTADPENLYIEHTDTMVFGPFGDFMNTTFVLLRRHGGVVARMPEQVMYADFTA